MGMGNAATTQAVFFAPSIRLFDGEPANDIRLDTSADGKPREVAEYKWIHCANEGTYLGHHQGEFELTRAVFEAFVRNFRDDPQYKAGSIELGAGSTYTGGVRPVLQFDYEHASEMPAFEGTIPTMGAPACGWVLDVQLRNGADGKAQLWAFGKLGPQIRGQIGRDEYRSVSIAFTLEAVHWQTGKPIGPALTSIAFTNHPFMRDLEPLAAANRRTSQPARAGLKPTHDHPEAPGGSGQSRTGAHMENVLRERVCKALKINLAATDEQVGEAVEEAASSGGSLKSLLESLGVKDVDGALKTLPELRSAREQLASLLAELDALLTQEVAADAGVAKVDIGAAAKAAGLSGDGASKALGAYRDTLMATEVAKAEKALKPGEKLKLSDWRAARTAGREKFLAEYGVKSIEHAHLSTTIVAGKGGAQYEPPQTGKPLAISDRTEDATGAIDLRGVSGNNPTERLITHLRKSESGFEKLPWEQQVQRAAELRTSRQLTLE